MSTDAISQYVIWNKVVASYSMQLRTEPYLEQQDRWPESGNVILAQYDDDSVVVYQAYKPTIGRFAAQHGYFGSDFKYSRMTWIKPNFLWMMYRSGWGTKPGQEVTLAIRLKRWAFDHILGNAVSSTFDASVYPTRDVWQSAVKSSDVRLQWDPDHDPIGEKLDRRAIQLGLRGKAIESFGRDWILDIEDVSEFVRKQHDHTALESRRHLHTPRETVYPVDDVNVAVRLGLRRDV